MSCTPVLNALSIWRRKTKTKSVSSTLTQTSYGKIRHIFISFKIFTCVFLISYRSVSTYLLRKSVLFLWGERQINGVDKMPHSLGLHFNISEDGTVNSVAAAFVLQLHYPQNTYGKRKRIKILFSVLFHVFSLFLFRIFSILRGNIVSENVSNVSGFYFLF